MLCFALNPALIFDTVIWGQSDSIVTLAMLVAAILVITKRHRLGWSAAAIAFLAKPQAIALFPPIGLLTLLDAGVAETVRCAAAFIVTLAIGAAPFQIGHRWDWIIAVYKDLGTRFSGASVGAFNFFGLIGAMNVPDTEKVLGVSYYSFGLSLTCAVYVIASYLIWRARTAQATMLAMFIALFGFFMFAPRMHERYLYYSLTFLALIALDARFLTAIFSAVTATFLYNLLYLKHLADTSSYFPDHPNLSMIATALVNLAVFFAATGYGLAGRPQRESVEGQSNP
jgi:Gpi18-like mannosyltransferase